MELRIYSAEIFGEKVFLTYVPIDQLTAGVASPSKALWGTGWTRKDIVAKELYATRDGQPNLPFFCSSFLLSFIWQVLQITTFTAL